MITKELVDFIGAQRAQGVNDQQIAGMLATQGWATADINAALAQSSVPVQAASAPVSLPQNSVPMQQATAGSSIGGPAGFWLRLVAAIIDGMIAQSFLIVLSAGLAFTLKGDIPSWIPFLLWIVTALYFIGMEASAKQATIGKMIAGVRVTDANGARISFLRSLGRYGMKVVSAMFPPIFLMIAFTDRKRALHDMVAGTLVIKYKESHIGRLILILMAIVLLLGLGTGAFAYFVVWPKISESMNTFSVQLDGDDAQTLYKNLDSDKAAFDEATGERPMTAAQYEALLSKPLVGVEDEYGDSSAYAGPAYIAFDGSRRLDVAMPVVPNMVGVTKTNYIKINHIYSKAGKEMNDPENSFQKDLFFSDFDPDLELYPVSHLHDGRNLYLLKDASGDIDRIEGELVLSLPLSSGGSLAKKYPFVLKVGSQAKPAGVSGQAASQSAAPSSLSATEKEAIISGILKTMKILSSGDPSVIRAFLLENAADESEKAEIREASDEDLREVSKTAALFYKGITAQTLRGPDVVWTVTSPTEVTLEISDSDGSTELNARKVNGKWF